MRVAMCVVLLAAGSAAAEHKKVDLQTAKSGDPRLDKLVAETWDGDFEQGPGPRDDAPHLIKSHVVMTLGPNDTISGTCTETRERNGKTYKSTHNVTGYLRRYNNTADLRIRYEKGDDIPNEVWCGEQQGTLTFYKDKDVSDGFILSGTVAFGDNCRGPTLLQLLARHSF